MDSARKKSIRIPRKKAGISAGKKASEFLGKEGINAGKKASEFLGKNRNKCREKSVRLYTI
jgi:hypothetical protein